jgi:hypothetical protein
MLDSALLGGLLGGIARMVPEVLKFFDRKNDRKHELALGAQQLDLIKVQGHNKLQEIDRTMEGAQMVAGIEAIKEAYRSQKTGWKFADSVSALVRPWITFVIFHAWLAVKVAAFTQLFQGGVEWNVAVITMWTDNDVAMLAGVTNFWFLSRVFEKKQ